MAGDAVLSAPAAHAAPSASARRRQAEAPRQHAHVRSSGRTAGAPAAPSKAAPKPIATAPPATAGASTTPAAGQPGPPLFWKIRPAVGCAHPDEYGLTAQERARCEALLSDLARAAPGFGSDVPPAKAAAFARSLRCRQMTEAQRGPAEGVFAGPSLRQCPPGEH